MSHVDTLMQSTGNRRLGAPVEQGANRQEQEMPDAEKGGLYFLHILVISVRWETFDPALPRARVP